MRCCSFPTLDFRAHSCTILHSQKLEREASGSETIRRIDACTIDIDRDLQLNLMNKPFQSCIRLAPASVLNI